MTKVEEGHKYTLVNVKMLVNKDSDSKRKVKEAIGMNKKANHEKRSSPQDLHILCLLLSCDPNGHVTLIVIHFVN